MEILDTIYARRAVRQYTARKVSEQDIRELIKAATYAPTAMDAQPWAFMVIQDRKRLNDLSERIKSSVLDSSRIAPMPDHLLKSLHDSKTDIFHGAGTLVVIYALSTETFAFTDCCLAAENLMLAARGLEIGSCPIGFAMDELSKSLTKRELGIPESCQPVLAMVLGYTDAFPQAPERKTAQILAWHRSPAEPTNA